MYSVFENLKKTKSKYNNFMPMIKVRVYAPGFINHDSIDLLGFVELNEGDLVYELYQKLKFPLPLRFIIPCSVNYEQATWNTKLKDGDTVTFLFPFSGG
jgi:molybdopterin converting factor small subunit